MGSIFFLLVVGAEAGQASNAVTKEEKRSKGEDDTVASPFGMTEEQDFMMSTYSFLLRTSTNEMSTSTTIIQLQTSMKG